MISRQLKWQRNKIAEGKCYRCGRPTRDNEQRCPSCIKKQQDRDNARNKARRSPVPTSPKGVDMDSTATPQHCVNNVCNRVLGKYRYWIENNGPLCVKCLHDRLMRIPYEESIKRSRDTFLAEKRGEVL